MHDLPEPSQEDKVAALDELISELIEAAAEQDYFVDLLDLLLRQFPEFAPMIREVAAEFADPHGQ